MKTINQKLWLLFMAILFAFAAKAQTPTTCSTAVTYTYPVTQTVTSYSNSNYWFTITTPGAGAYALEITNSSGSGKIINADVYIGSCSSLTLCAADSLTNNANTSFVIPLNNTVSTTYYINLTDSSASAVTFSITTVRQLYIAGQLSYQLGGSDSLIAYPVGASGTPSYTWMPGSIHTAQLAPTATVNTTYTLTYSDGLGTLTDTATARPLHVTCQLARNGGFTNCSAPANSISNIQPYASVTCSGFITIPWTEGPTSWQGSPTCGTPDYYSTMFNSPPNGVGVPYNVSSNSTGLADHTGVGGGYVGLYTYGLTGYREYVQSELACALVSGQLYNVSYWVSTGSASPYTSGSTPINLTPSNNIGAYFSTSAVSAITNGNLNYTPQVNAINTINNPNTWTEVTGTITGGGQQYITLGNFYGDPNTSPYPNETQESYYFLDDISVTPVTPTITASSCQSGYITLTAYGAASANTSWTDGTNNYSGNPISYPSPSSATTLTCTVSLPSCSVCSNMTATITIQPQTPCSGTQPSSYSPAAGTYNFTSNPGYFASSMTLASGVNYTIHSAEVRMAAGTSITVASGATLTVEGSWLHACDQCTSTNMWQGIIVNNGGRLIMQNVSGNDNIVEDAVQAVYMSTGTSTPNYTITHTFFNNNSTDIYIDANTANLSSQQIYDNLFTCRNFHSHSVSATGNLNGIATDIRASTPLHPSLVNPTDLTIAGARTQYGVYVNTGNITNPIVIGSSSGGGSNTFDNMDIGLYAAASSLTAYSNIFENLTGNSTDLKGIGIYSDATFLGHCSGGPCAVASTLIVGNPSTTIVSGEANTFTNCLIGVYTNDMVQVYINNNTFNNETTATTYNTSGTYVTGGYGVWQNGFAYKASATNFENLDFANNTVQNYANGHYMTFNELYNTNALGSGNSMNIQGNTITATGTGTGSNYCTYGLYLNQSSAGSVSTIPSNALSITTNTITNVSTNAIYALNVNTSSNTVGFLQIYDNGELSVQYNPACTTLVGPPRVASICLNDCYYTRVTYNTDIRITGFSGTSVPAVQYIGGVYVYESEDNVINCNTVSNTGEDFIFEGTCTSTGNNWQKNSMDYSKYGLVLRNGGIMGNQGSATYPINDTWGASSHFTDQTLADNSNPGTIGSTSYLYTQGTGVYKPTTNGSAHSGTAYSGTTLPTASGVNTLTCGVSSNDRVTNSNELLALNNVASTISNTRINLYPNPNNGSMQVDYLVKDDARMEMMDITGNIVGTYNLPASGTSIQVKNDNLQSGIYLYRIISNNTVIKQGKVVVMK